MKQMCTWRCWVYKHCGARILSSIIADKFLEGLKSKFNVFFKELYGRAQKIDRNTGTSIQMNEASVLCRRYTRKYTVHRDRVGVIQIILIGAKIDLEDAKKKCGKKATMQGSAGRNKRTKDIRGKQ
jgi:hypothetical protein